MPIPSNKAHVSIDFIYQHSSGNDGDEYQIRYHHVDDEAKISISQDGQDWFSFPAQLFDETVEYLSRQGVLVSSKDVKKVKPEPKDEQHQPVNEKQTGLPMPQIARAVSNMTNASEGSEKEEHINMPDVDPLESFVNTAEIISKAASGPKKKKEISADIPNRPVYMGMDEEQSKALRGEPKSSVRRA